jgi:FKBP-type peptidyl-prolyl cis-trans isomerase
MKVAFFKPFVALLIAFVVFNSCDSTPAYTELPSGYKFRAIEAKGGRTPEVGDALLVEMKHYLGEDSLIFDSKETNPTGLMLRTGISPDLMEVLNMCGEGDSVQIQMSLEQYVNLSGAGGLPEGTDTTQNITWNIKVMQVENESTMLENLILDQKQKEVKYINEYLVNNNLEAEHTEEGVYYVISDNGNGEYPQEGDSVFVNYAVTVMQTGELIDTSFEDIAKENDIHNPRRRGGYVPYGFVVGRPGVIPGWQIGVPKFSKGARGKLFVPSQYGYGARPRGPQIPANSTLMFEIELVDIK